MKNCYYALPENYKKVYEINAKNKKTAILFTLASFVPFIITVAIALLTKDLSDVATVTTKDLIITGVKFLSFSVLSIVYIVLHELTHGAAYKILTGAKLKFGISLSCAFCGVPEVYVNKKTALIALASPLVLFGVLFAILSVVFWFFDPICYLLSMAFLGLHLGGCVGDIYMLCMLCFKYDDKDLLLNDDGPSQRIYFPVCGEKNNSTKGASDRDNSRADEEKTENAKIEETPEK